MVSAQDPGNVGTVLRTADAVGTDAVFLVDGGVDPYHPTCVRASMGTLFWKPIVQTSFMELVAWSHARGIQLIGTSAHAKMDYREFKPTRQWILMLGSEQKGLSAEYLNACDAKISMPMRGRVSSLNIAVAAGVLMYQFST
jgi:TrmH family RNA methyltransferase